MGENSIDSFYKPLSLIFSPKLLTWRFSPIFVRRAHVSLEGSLVKLAGLFDQLLGATFGKQ